MYIEVLFMFLVTLAVVGHVGSVSTAPGFRGVPVLFENKNLSLQSFDALDLTLPNHSEAFLHLTLPNHSALRQSSQAPALGGAMLFIGKLLEEPSSLEELGKTARLVSICLFILLVVGLLVLCAFEEDENAGTDGTGGTQTPKSSKNLSEGEVLLLSEAAWPRAYLMANWDERKALELLLLCGIIHPDEFRRGDVSDEHVDECMWIAMQMLRQKPLEAWTRDPESAQRAFYTSVTSRFPERQVLRSNLPTSGQVTPDFAPSPGNKEAPSYVPSERGVMDCYCESKRPSEPASPPAPLPLPQFYRRDNSASHIKKVQVRCQELATGNAIDLTPRCMLRALQGMPPPKVRDKETAHWPEGYSLPPSEDVLFPEGAPHVFGALQLPVNRGGLSVPSTSGTTKSPTFRATWPSPPGTANIPNTPFDRSLSGASNASNCLQARQMSNAP